MGKHSKYYTNCDDYCYKDECKNYHKYKKNQYPSCPKVNLCGPIGSPCNIKPICNTGITGPTGPAGPAGPSSLGIFNFFERVNTIGGTALPNILFGPVIYDTLEIGTLPGYNTTTGQFTPPINGFYSITASLGYNSDNTGLYRKLRMTVAGSFSKTYEILNPPHLGTDGILITVVLFLTTNNIVSIYFIHDAIIPLVFATGNYSKLTIIKL